MFRALAAEGAEHVLRIAVQSIQTVLLLLSAHRHPVQSAQEVISSCTSQAWQCDKVLSFSKYTLCFGPCGPHIDQATWLTPGENRPKQNAVQLE